jgi:hypothetical protein
LGLKHEQLQQLLEKVEKAIELHHQKQQLVESKKIRIILGGGGRKPKLSPSEQIILTLTYLRQLTTFQLLGIQFGVSETTANDMQMISLTIGCQYWENYCHQVC